MSDEQDPTIVVFCPEGETLAEMRELAERYHGGAPVQVFAANGPAEAVAMRARSRYGGSPLGILVSDETEALHAIEAGVDDAMVLGRVDPIVVLGFFDRVLLRAQKRRERERLQADFVHSEKLAALGTLVAGVAHEVNNPLTALLLSVEGLAVRIGPLHRAYSALEKMARQPGEVTKEQVREVLEIGRTGAEVDESEELLEEISDAADAISKVVKDLTVFARQDQEEAPTIVDVTVLLDQVVRMLGRQLRTQATLEIDYESEPPAVVAPRSRLTQVFTNLLLNAAHAVGEVERESHRIRISVRADEEALAVSVSDTGPGIAPDVLGKIFDPFFTTKREGTGTGLGLSISRSILRRLGGDLMVESVHNQGATFIALIPRPDRRALFEASRGTVANTQPTIPQIRKRRVLVVDEDERVLRSFARALDRDHDVILAADAEEALALLDSGSHADVIVADASPPEANGITLYKELRARNSALADAIVFVINREDTVDAQLSEAAHHILHKPASRAQLVGAVDEVLAHTTEA